MSQFVSLDLPPILCAMFACLSCAILGNFLVLRRLSLMGDAISHAVLPGIILAFLLTGARAGTAIFIGAAAAGILAAVLVELVRGFGRLEAGAAMGVVFSIMFASGVLLIEQAAARNIDLDADCLLNGQLETIFWYPPENFKEFFSLNTLGMVPMQVKTSFAVFIASVFFTCVFFKELALTAFDPALATSLGLNARGMHYMLMVVVAGAVVASFEAVGSILVIAMLICPAATARFYTDRLKVQVVLSLVFCSLSVLSGYLCAVFVPVMLGYANALSAAGMMTVAAGVILFGSAVFAPEYGLVSRQVRRLSLRLKVYREDILTDLLRHEERNEPGASMSPAALRDTSGRGILWHRALKKLSVQKLIIESGGAYSLSGRGREEAQALLRSHRLWESFLVDQAGIQPDHVHGSAEKLEHFTEAGLSSKLAEEQAHKSSDPHGKPIP